MYPLQEEDDEKGEPRRRLVRLEEVKRARVLTIRGAANYVGIDLGRAASGFLLILIADDNRLPTSYSRIVGAYM